MISAEFWIIDQIDFQKDYSTYEPSLSTPETALARWGVTLIPPESLVEFKDIVLSDKHIYSDDNLVALANLIQLAIGENKYMIHYGI